MIALPGVALISPGPTAASLHQKQPPIPDNSWSGYQWVLFVFLVIIIWLNIIYLHDMKDVGLFGLQTLSDDLWLFF